MSFPAPHIRHPQGAHTHTIVLLHGRGSNGPEFADELFSSCTSDGRNLASRLPNCRWVFSTSRDRWSTTFQEELCAWFDVYSLSDIQARQDLQKDGLQESISHVLDILESEARLLDGQLPRLYLGGMSQGMATALWVFIAAVATGRIQGRLGGLLGFCGWLPFAHNLENILGSSVVSAGPCTLDVQRLVSQFFFDEIARPETLSPVSPVDFSAFTTPVLLIHGTDDAWVSVELGQQALRVLRQILRRVEWIEYTGAENDGHWIKEPEGFDQILKFLGSQTTV